MTSISTSEHGGQAASDGTRKVLSRLEILPPGSICTETYLIAGRFSSETEAVNNQKYLASRFTRFLLYAATITQHITRSSFMFVPNMTADLLWTDEDLYDFFGISPAHIGFIESMIRSMAVEGDE